MAKMAYKREKSIISISKDPLVGGRMNVVTPNFNQNVYTVLLSINGLKNSYNLPYIYVHLTNDF